MIQEMKGKTCLTSGIFELPRPLRDATIRADVLRLCLVDICP